MDQIIKAKIQKMGLSLQLTISEFQELSQYLLQQEMAEARAMKERQEKEAKEKDEINKKGSK